MKIGIFAGTFDPIHNGHLAFAQRAVKEAGLARVVIIAEKKPYRKQPHASWDHRQAMIERATEALTQVDHDYQFANQLAHQHTMQDMLSIARQHYGADHRIWFLVGSDVFEHIHHWQELVEASNYGGFAVALRHDHSMEWVSGQIQQLASQYQPQVVTINNLLPSLTSTKIRQAVNSTQTLTGLPSAVASYITSHKLYLSTK